MVEDVFKGAYSAESLESSLFLEKNCRLISYNLNMIGYIFFLIYSLFWGLPNERSPFMPTQTKDLNLVDDYFKIFDNF